MTAKDKACEHCVNKSPRAFHVSPHHSASCTLQILQRAAAEKRSQGLSRCRFFRSKSGREISLWTIGRSSSEISQKETGHLLNRNRKLRKEFSAFPFNLSLRFVFDVFSERHFLMLVSKNRIAFRSSFLKRVRGATVS